ncbi:MAG: 4-hydroxybenzoate octaprenyltransferase [Dehalococcoidia bacterium]|nr:4-hydroxybenzoate octaprenyltransferase [Dehalococcoidia bacterium]
MSSVKVAAKDTNAVKKDKLSLFLETIKFEHTIFALPFAYIALFLVSGGWPSLSNLGWVTIAMAGARTFGMGVNRIIDARIDAANPRTAQRALASGKLSMVEGIAFVAVAFAVFLIAVYQLSEWAGYLWPPVIFMMTVYPYFKRFTWLCHLGLGLTYLMVPSGVWVAVANEISLSSVVLSLAAMFWVTGFDLIYACQDVDVDRKQGLYSFPSKFGIGAGLNAAKFMHIFTVSALAVAGVTLEAGPLYYLGVAVAASILFYEHTLVSLKDLSKLNAAFFTMNGIMSVVFFIFVAADVLIRSN